MKKVSMKTRKEIIEANKKEYQKATKKEKKQILDSICCSTGLSRDRAARVLRKKSFNKKINIENRGRKVKYGPKVAKALEFIWTLMDYACGKRIAAGMSVMLDALERHGELVFDSDVVQKLREISSFTIDKLLKPVKKAMSYKGISTTKPGTLLKKDIPLRLGTEWDDAIPGYTEIDLVAHCGDTAAGDYVQTLDVTDICTGWTETQAVINKAQKNVFDGLIKVEARLPFPLLGIDSDNGKEFINHQLYRYCLKKGICFTRSRPYNKNDNCHVEQKNWAVVRRNIGYDRYEGQKAVKRLNAYYEKLRLYSNFFLPQTKLIRKYRVDSKICKEYEKPKTPYQRIQESIHIPASTKKELEKIFLTLNPVALKEEMEELLEEIFKIKIPWSGYHN